jgi:molybdate transport system permease protein
MGLSITMITALLLTLKLALVTVFFLFILCIPLCYWLIATDNFPRKLVLSICTLPLVLPPTVLGFYLILLLRPEGFVSLITNLIGIETLLFSFEGLVAGSIIYSLPFVLQPLYTSLKAVPNGYFDTLKILGYTKFNGYIRFILPMIEKVSLQQ